MVQEVYDKDGAKFLLTDGLRRTSPNKYLMGDFYDDPDSDLELSVFYNSKEIKCFKKSFTVVNADPRVICGYQFKVKTGKAKGAKFWIYAVHLKASSGSTKENDRATASRILRDHLNDKQKDSLILVGGDYNLYTSNEKTWEILTGAEDDDVGRLMDPINNPGDWHDNKKFKKIHTQCPRKEQFGGGAYGELDDRFDFILMSTAFENNKNLVYKPETYVAYGNDGRHFNKSVNKPKNRVINKIIANALYKASDHLPVLMELVHPSELLPSKPSYLLASALSGDKIKISWWDNSSNEDDFYIERKLESSTKWTQIADFNANVESYTDTSLSARTTYQYRVQVYNSFGMSDYSNIATKKTLSGITVYITKTGSKYHRWGCKYLKDSCILIDLDEAKARGYTPSSECNPPTSKIKKVISW